MFRTMKTLILPGLALSLAAAGCAEAPSTTTGDGYLFGLSADEVLAARRVAHTDMSDAAWLDLHRGEFDCARYGDLCRDVGKDAAYDVIETGYLMAIDGADRDAIRAAQDDAIAEARAARANQADTELYATTTNFFFGGSGNKRLKVAAHATEMWPSLELRASADCTFQKDSLGWWAAKADSLSGTMTATFSASGSSVTITRTASGSDVSSIDMGPNQRDADHLTVSVSCAASEDVWSASGTATVGI